MPDGSISRLVLPKLVLPTLVLPGSIVELRMRTGGPSVRLVVLLPSEDVSMAPPLGLRGELLGEAAGDGMSDGLRLYGTAPLWSLLRSRRDTDSLRAPATGAEAGDAGLTGLVDLPRVELKRDDRGLGGIWRSSPSEGRAGREGLPRPARAALGADWGLVFLDGELGVVPVLPRRMRFFFHSGMFAMSSGAGAGAGTVGTSVVDAERIGRGGVVAPPTLNGAGIEGMGSETMRSPPRMEGSGATSSCISSQSAELSSGSARLRSKLEDCEDLGRKVRTV